MGSALGWQTKRTKPAKYAVTELSWLGNSFGWVNFGKLLYNLAAPQVYHSLVLRQVYCSLVVVIIIGPGGKSPFDTYVQPV